MDFHSKLPDIYQKFLEIEKTHDLISLELKGVKVWQYLRFKIYREIHREIDLYGVDHTKKTGLLYLISRFPSLLYNS
ncbi:hypothetical protein ACFLSE_08690, partial [Bacteroidota bacterium]